MLHRTKLAKNRDGSKKETYVSELQEPKFAEIRDGTVSRFDRNDELDESHLLRSHQIHGRQVVDEVVHFRGNQTEDA